jgi:hypothetical protein
LRRLRNSRLPLNGCFHLCPGQNIIWISFSIFDSSIQFLLLSLSEIRVGLLSSNAIPDGLDNMNPLFNSQGSDFVEGGGDIYQGRRGCRANQYFLNNYSELVLTFSSRHKLKLVYKSTLSCHDDVL